MTLPDELTVRPATTADLHAVYQLIRTCEIDLDGQPEIDEDDVVMEFARKGFDLSRDTRVVHDKAGELVGWAQLHRERGEADVHPAYRGRGLGTELLAWIEERAHETGADKVGQTVTDNNVAAADLFRRNGYQVHDTSWILEIDLGTEPELPPLPDGIRIRSYRPGQDDHGVHRVIDEAFCEWPDRKPSSFEDWSAFSIGRETFSPELSTLALDGDRIVGAALVLDYQDENEGYVHQLAVHRDYRYRGIARALLRHTFRSFHRQGRPMAVLSTNSYTGALTLYERIGMRIRQSYTRYEKRLTPLRPAEVHQRLVDSYPDIVAGRLDGPLTLIDPDVVDHRGGTQGDHRGIDAWRRKWESFAGGTGAFHDVSVTVEQNVVAGDTSVNRYTSRGTHTDSGRRYEVTSMDMVRVRDGKVVEHWAVRDSDAIRHQLDLGPTT